MALDLRYNIKRCLSGDGWSSELDEMYDIRQCDDLDEEYIIRLREGYAGWISCFRNSRFFIEEITSPEKGFLEVKLRKWQPIYTDEKTRDEFLEEVADYFTDTFYLDYFFPASFRMTEEPILRMEDGEYVCHGTVLTLDGPVSGEDESYMIFSEEMKAFILRKLEAIFETKGAKCYEKSDGNKKFPHYHYSFKLFT